MVDNAIFNLVPNDEEEEFVLEFGELTDVGRGGTRDFNELENRPQYNGETMTGETNIPEVPSKVSDLDNDSGYQTGAEVQTAIETAIGEIEIPTKTSDLTNDGSDGTSTYVEADDLAAVATSGDYNDLSNKPTIPTDTTYSAGNAITIDENDNNRIDAAIYPADYFTASASQNGNGTIFSLNNTMAATLKNVELYGDTEQNAYSGKNLVLFSTILPTRCTYTESNGVYSITATGDSPSIRFALANNIPAGTYTWSSTISGWTISPRATDGSSLGVNSAEATHTITISADMGYISFFSSATSGSVVTLDLSKFQIEAGSTATDFEPYVGGTPSPSPDYPQDIRVVSGGQTIKIDGKNLFSTENITTGKRLDSSGNFVNDTSYMTSDFLPVKPNTTYTYSRYANGGGSACCCEYGEGQTFILRNFWNGQVNQQKKFFTFTTGENTHFIRICDFTALTKQLEFGDVSTEYEVYQLQKYEINLGKNLFDISKVQTNGTHLVNNGDGTITVDWANGASAAAPNTLGTFCPNLRVGDTVVLSYSGDNVINYIYLGSPASQTWVRGATKVITQDMLNAPVIWYGASGNVAVTYTEIQIEIGTTPSSYMPYREPIELCKINDYKDYIFKSNGTWYLHKEIRKKVLDGTETWSSQTGSHTVVSNFYTPTYIGWGVYAGNKPLFCSIARSNDAAGSSNDSIINICRFNNTGTNFLLDVSQSEFPTVTSFQTWIGNHNVALYYVLATPTDTEITDVDLLNQLNALGSGKSYLDVTDFSVTASGANLPAVLDVEVFDNSLAGMSGAIETKQDKLIAGENITIDNNIISATGGSSINVVQTTGTSTEDVMSQNAASSMVFADPGTDTKIQIGSGANGNWTDSVVIGGGATSYATNCTIIGKSAVSRGNGVAIGKNAKAGTQSSHNNAVAVGYNAQAQAAGAIALGRDSTATAQGEMNIGTSNTGWGYSSSNYRLISGVYDGQSAHDAVTVEQVNATIDAINTALSTNIPHIGA